MSELIGLPGTDGKPRIIKEYGQSVSHMMKLFKKYGHATCAGNNGSITIWKDDEGVFRGYRSVYCSVKDTVQTSFKGSMRDWLKVHYPQIQ